MIQYVKGNLFESSADALVNTVNTVGVMGKGIALQFREAFPYNYRVYRKACQSKELNIGQMLITEDTSDAYGKKTIINFPTKQHWRYPSEYTFIAQGLFSLRNEIEKRGIRSVAIPPLGSNNGGLEWERVKTMIEDVLSDLDCCIYLYEPSEAIVDKMKSERVKLTPARAMLLVMMADMNRCGEFASVFAAEKLIYFMQRFGGRDYFKIEFKPYFYGPYSGGKVAHVLYHLNGSYIKGMVGMQNRPFDYIWLTDDAESEAIKFIDNSQDDGLLDICEKTMDFLRGSYSTYSLELLSSIDYLLQNTATLCNWREMQEEKVLELLEKAMHEWSPRKEHLFKPEFMARAFDYLKIGMK